MPSKQDKNKQMKQVVNTMWVIPQKDIVDDNGENKATKGKRERLNAIIDDTSDKINNAQGILEILPDTHLIGEILVSSTLSPKDLTVPELKVQTTMEVSSEFGDAIVKHLNKELDLESKLAPMLYDSLFLKGSQPILTIPPHLIQTLINDSTMSLESIEDGTFTPNKSEINNLGFLKAVNGIKASPAMESLNTKMVGADKASELITLSDNVSYLLEPDLLTSMESLRTTKLMDEAYGMENMDIPDTPVYPYLQRKFVEESEVKVVNKDKKNKGIFNPVTIFLPPESVIPVILPGQPKDPIGFYIAIEESTGHPIARAGDSNYFKDLNKRLNKSLDDVDSQKSMLSTFGLSAKNDGEADIRKIQLDAWREHFDTMLATSMRGKNVEVKSSSHIYKLMFARVLAKKKTRLVYIPAEMLTYIAFNYNASGVGVSLIEKNILFASYRAVSMISKLMQGIRRSVPLRKLEVTLDEHDIDPAGTIADVKHEYAAMDSDPIARGMINPTDITKAIQKSGIQVKVNGGDIYPNTSIESEDTQRDSTPFDSDLDELLKVHYYAGFGVSPETVDSKLEGEFATSVAANDLLESQRILLRQMIYSGHLSTFIQRYIHCKGPLWNVLHELYEALPNKEDFTFNELVDSMAVILPRPTSAAHKAQKEEFGIYVAFLDDAIDAYATEDAIEGLIDGEFAPDIIPAIIMSMRRRCIRTYLTEQNMLPELNNMVSLKDNTVADGIISHNDGLLSLVKDILTKMRKKEYKFDTKMNAFIDKLEEPEEDEEIVDNGTTDEDGGEVVTDDDDGGEGDLDAGTEVEGGETEVTDDAGDTDDGGDELPEV